MEDYLRVCSLIKELRSSPTDGLRFYPLDLSEAVIGVFADSSWANTVGHKSQAGYIVYLCSVSSMTSDGGVGNVIDFKSHRLKRACHCTLYAEAMASRTGSGAASWCRQMLLEIVSETYRATICSESKSRVWER